MGLTLWILQIPQMANRDFSWDPCASKEDKVPYKKEIGTGQKGKKLFYLHTTVSHGSFSVLVHPSGFGQAPKVWNTPSEWLSLPAISHRWVPPLPTQINIVCAVLLWSCWAKSFRELETFCKTESNRRCASFGLRVILPWWLQIKVHVTRPCCLSSYSFSKEGSVVW